MSEFWTRRRVVQVISRFALVLALVFAAVVFATGALIGSAVHAASEAALQGQPTDRVLALMAYIESPKHTLKERNRAVWALGQLGDARAVPALQRYVTGEKCDHAHRLCQHELRKAIRLCSGSINLTAHLWR
jgi:HEAT repeat protein